MWIFSILLHAITVLQKYFLITEKIKLIITAFDIGPKLSKIGIKLNKRTETKERN